MNLYEISIGYKELLEMFDNSDLTEEEIQAVFDTLESIGTVFEQKVENIACFLKNLNSEITAIDTEIKALQQRKKQKENTVKRLKKYLQDNLTAVEKKKVETARCVVTIRNNPESVNVLNDEELLHWLKQNNTALLKYEEPTLRKAEIKKAVQNGEYIPFVELVKTQSVVIK